MTVQSIIYVEGGQRFGTHLTKEEVYKLPLRVGFDLGVLPIDGHEDPKPFILLCNVPVLRMDEEVQVVNEIDIVLDQIVAIAEW